MKIRNVSPSPRPSVRVGDGSGGCGGNGGPQTAPSPAQAGPLDRLGGRSPSRDCAQAAPRRLSVDGLQQAASKLGASGASAVPGSQASPSARQATSGVDALGYSREPSVIALALHHAGRPAAGEGLRARVKALGDGMQALLRSRAPREPDAVARTFHHVPVGDWQALAAGKRQQLLTQQRQHASLVCGMQMAAATTFTTIFALCGAAELSPRDLAARLSAGLRQALDGTPPSGSAPPPKARLDAGLGVIPREPSPLRTIAREFVGGRDGETAVLALARMSVHRNSRRALADPWPAREAELPPETKARRQLDTVQEPRAALMSSEEKC